MLNLIKKALWRGAKQAEDIQIRNNSIYYSLSKLEDVKNHAGAYVLTLDSLVGNPVQVFKIYTVMDKSHKALITTVDEESGLDKNASTDEYKVHEIYLPDNFQLSRIVVLNEVAAKRNNNPALLAFVGQHYYAKSMPAVVYPLGEALNVSSLF